MDAVAPFADPLAQSIPARFEQEVARGAERLAVKTRHHTMSYGALNRAANRVAHATSPSAAGAKSRSRSSWRAARP